jgi:hypothetical protein
MAGLGHRGPNQLSVMYAAGESQRCMCADRVGAHSDIGHLVAEPGPCVRDLLVPTGRGGSRHGHLGHDDERPLAPKNRLGQACQRGIHPRGSVGVAAGGAASMIPTARFSERLCRLPP